MLPNLVGLLVVQGTIQFSLGVIAEAGLSYVGLERAAADTQLGPHAQRGANLDGAGAVPCALPRLCGACCSSWD